MHVGFTGTREGMTQKQKGAFYDTLNSLHWLHGNFEFHHGGCMGADAQAHYGYTFLIDEPTVYIHPPINTSFKANCRVPSVIGGRQYNFDPKDYLPRNRDIVDACGILIATPKGEDSNIGGTGYTIRYAKKQGVPVITIYPDGRVEDDRS